MIRLLPLIAAVLVTACQPIAGPAPVQDACGSGDWQRFLGAPLADLQVAGLPTSARIIRPGDAVTMDFSETRLNIQLDAGDRLARAYCG